MAQFNINTAKIVGTAQAKKWSQVHIFIPPEKSKRAEFGSLLAAFSLKRADDQAVEVGKELIQRFHEIYFSSQETEVFYKLKNSFKKLKNELGEENKINLTVGVIWQPQDKAIFYGARIGTGNIWLKRQDQLVKLMDESSKLISGYLQADDKLLLATARFGQLVDIGQLNEAFQFNSTQEITENLAPLVHGQEKNSRAAAIIVQVELIDRSPASADEIRQVEPQKAEAGQPDFLPKAKLDLKSRFQEVVLAGKDNFSWLKKRHQAEPEVYLKGKKQPLKKRKLGFTIAIILMSLLGLSVILGSQRQSQRRTDLRLNSIYEQIEAPLREAQSLAALNPLRSKILFEEALSILKENQTKYEPESEEYQQLGQKIGEITRSLAEVSHSYEKEADVWLDLNLAKEGFKGQAWDKGGSGLLIWDQDQPTLLEINTESKSAQIVAGKSELKDFNWVAANEDWAWLADNGQIYQINIGRQTTNLVKEDQEWGRISGAVGFATNLYLLDETQNQVWKYVPSGNGLADKQAYLVGEFNLNSSIDLAVDGSVWVAFQNGQIFKFTRGKRDAYHLTGLSQPLTEPTKIWTDENTENLYILDPKTTRIVVTDKRGEFKSEYIWPGLSGAKDIYVDESQGIILVLTGEKIFKINL